MKRWSAALILAWSLALTACGVTIKPPSQPGQGPTPPIALEHSLVIPVRTDAGMPIDGCRLWWGDSGRFTGTTNLVAAISWQVPAEIRAGFLHLACDGYLPYDQDITTDGTNQTVIIGGGPGVAANDLRLPAPTRIKPPAPPTPRLHVVGTKFYTPDNKEFQVKFAADLSILRRSEAERAILFQQWVTLKFNGIRLFAGDLGWANQTPMLARDQLASLLEQAQSYGIYVQIDAVTGAATGFDVADHLRAIRDTAERFTNSLLVGANEPGHPTQSALVNDFPQFCALLNDLFRSTNVPWALGAILGVDEPDSNGHYAGVCGPFSTAHLDRSRDLFNQGRRVREIFAIKETSGRAILNDEPLGCADFEQPGRRSNQPWFFFLLELLNRLFGVGGVFHSEDGLNSVPLSPKQTDCARAFIAAATVIPTDESFSYRNVGQVGSPIKTVRFAEDGGPIVRFYSFVSASARYGYSVAIHVPDALTDPSAFEMAEGWHIAGALPGMPHVSIFRVER